MMASIMRYQLIPHQHFINMSENKTTRVESRIEVNTYIDRLKYALSNGAVITFQIKRLVDDSRDEHYTNQYTINKLFPDKDPTEVLRDSLQALSVEEYIHTVKDLKFPNRSDMRVFGRTYEGSGDVYIKIRVELLGEFGEKTVFVMSFHFAETAFTNDIFPYKETWEDLK